MVPPLRLAAICTGYFNQLKSAFSHYDRKIRLSFVHAPLCGLEPGGTTSVVTSRILYVYNRLNSYATAAFPVINDPPLCHCQSTIAHHYFHLP